MTDREPPEPVQIGLGEKRFVPTPPAPPEPSASPKSIPWKKIGEGLAAVRKGISLKEIGEGLAAARTVIVNGLMLVSLFAIIYFAVAELRREVVVIDPIRLPEALRQMGYSEDVAADRLWDEMARINERTPTAKERVALQPASQKMDFEPPGSGIALQEVVQMLRRVLRRPESRIVGEITCMTTECKPEGLALTLRVYHADGTKSEPLKILPEPPIDDQTNEAEIDQNPFGDGMKIIFLDPIGDQTNEAEIDRYFRAAGIELLREIDPYVVALFLYQNKTDKGAAAAEDEAQQLLNDPTHPDRKWALNLLGFIAADRGDHDAAIGWYERAVKADKKDEFAIAYYNWGNALSAKGDPKGAIEKFTRATKLDPKNAFAYNSWGIALGNTRDLDGAIEQFTRATKLDPEYADAYNNWGSALRVKGELDEAIAKFTHATEIDPENALAYYNWGRALRAKADLPEAIEKFTLLAEAIEKFTRATELDSEYADAHLKKALALSELSNGDDPPDRLQRYAGDAVDAFQRYLVVLDKPDSGMANLARSRIKKLRDQIEQLRADAMND